MATVNLASGRGPMTTTERYAELELAAQQAGHAAGVAAASWYFDGNTTTATYQWVLAGIQDGDPEVLDALPSPDLSGEYADGPTPFTLRTAIEATEKEWELDGDYLCTAWEEAASAAVEESLVKTAHSQLEGDA